MTTINERILEKLDSIGTDVAVLKSKMPDVSSQLGDHEKRLRSLEARLWYAVGAVALLAFAVPLVVLWLSGKP